MSRERSARPARDASPRISLPYELWHRAPRSERFTAAIAFATGIIWSASIVAVPYLAGHAVNALGTPEAAAEIAKLCLLIAVLALAKSLALRVRRYYTFVTSSRVIGRLRHSVYAQLHTHEAGFFDQTPDAEVLTALGDDAEYIEHFGMMLQVLLNNFSWTALIVGVLLWLNPVLALATLAPLPLILLLTLRFLKVLAPANAKMRADSRETVGLVADAVAGAAVVRGLGLDAHFVRRLSDVTQRTRGDANAAAYIQARYTALIQLVPTISVAIVLVLGAARIRSGELTVGAFTTFVSYVVMAVWPMRSTATAIAGLARARVALARILALESPRQQSPPTSAMGAAQAPEPGIDLVADTPLPVRLAHVSFRYHAGHEVLSEADLEIEAGQVVAIQGVTGSGKSTLLRLISGEYAPDDGSVTIGGFETSSLAPAQRAQLVSLVTNNEFLFARSIGDNLRFARPGAGEDELRRAAGLAVLDRVVAGLDDGWNTLVGEHGTRLSGGERQRVALARGVLSPAGVLLLDDVTTALDSHTRQTFAAGFGQLRRGRTVVLVTAVPALLELADRVFVLSDGRLTERTGSVPHR